MISDLLVKFALIALIHHTHAYKQCSTLKLYLSSDEIQKYILYRSRNTSQIDQRAGLGLIYRSHHHLSVTFWSTYGEGGEFDKTIMDGFKYLTALSMS